MGIFSSDEEPCWSDVYNLQTRNTILELRIDKLRTCLQDIKAIVCGNYEIIDPQGRKDILKLITKAESEDNQ